MSYTGFHGDSMYELEREALFVRVSLWWKDGTAAAKVKIVAGDTSFDTTIVGGEHNSFKALFTRGMVTGRSEPKVFSNDGWRITVRQSKASLRIVMENEHEKKDWTFAIVDREDLDDMLMVANEEETFSSTIYPPSVNEPQGNPFLKGEI